MNQDPAPSTHERVPAFRIPTFCAAFLLAVLTACRSSTPPPAPVTTNASLAPPTLAPAISVTNIELHNVLIHEDDLLSLRIRWLRGQLLPARPHTIPSFDDKTSLVFQIDSGVIAVSAADITNLLNHKVLAYPHSPLTNVTVTTQGEQLRLTGTLQKGIPVPIEMLATVSAAPDGRIRIHPVKLSALGIPVRGILKGLGLHVADLIDPKAATGLTVQNDDVLLNMDLMLPAPKQRGHITAVHIRGNDLVETYGGPRDEAVQARPWKNFITCRGGTLQFGKLTMHDADMIMIDTSADAWFDFFLDHYRDQLRAGYIKITPSQGLQVFMLDYDKLTSRSSLVPPASQRAAGASRL